MANTHTWKIFDLKRDVADGYVSEVTFSITSKDELGNGITTEYTKALPKPSSLVPYKDLTESTVINWVKAKATADSEDLEAAGDTALSTHKTNDSTAYGIPW
tara:strand:+ start:125 stop:430 length:306 start_codon:yes stop_codon:yes gene_type:complete